MKLRSAGLLAALTLVAPNARAATGDWFTQVYSPGGVEVRADERLFTLFALLNALGYDEAPIVRKEPVAKRELSPVRVQVRQALATLDPAVTEKVSAFFDAHPAPLSDYVAYVLQLDAAPTFTAPAGAHPKALAGFEKQLAAVYEAGKLHEVFAQVQSGYRASTEAYLSAVDGPLGAARKLLRDPAVRAVVAVNDLDGRGITHAVALDDGAFLVIGPSGKPDVEAAVRAFARVVLDPVTGRKASALKGAADQAAVVRGSGGPALEGAAEYESELLARAIAIKVAAADANAAEEQALKQGFAGIKEAVKLVDDLAKPDQPLDAAVGDLLGKIDLKKAAAGKGG